MTPFVIGALVVVVLVALVVLFGRRRRDTDGVAVFQRQIDALSPEARRPVVDRVQQIDAAGAADADPDDGDGDDAGSDDDARNTP